MKKRDLGTLAAGMALGAALTGGAVAAGIVAQPAWSPIYVDGQQVQMEAYNINGNNYVRLRDIGKEVGFNVYYDAGVQVDSKSPYTGEAPNQVPAKEEISVSSYKGSTLKVGDRSMLMIGTKETCSVQSSNPAVADVELVSNQWVVVAKSAGTAVITVKSSSGETGQLMLTVTGGAAASKAEKQTVDSNAGVDLKDNWEIRQEMIRLINQVRRENGAAELEVNEALMNAAQDCAQQGFKSHDLQYENESGLLYGYPHGFGSNLTVFSYNCNTDIAQTAVSHWKYSPGHFQTMIADRYDSIGVGLMLRNDVAYCYMFAGNPDGINPSA